MAGLLLGLAAGDRIGGPLRMALRVAESLRDLGTFNPQDIGARYLTWWREGAFDTGTTAARVLELASSGVLIEDASLQVHTMVGGLTAGCNPAHRSAPLAMLAAIEDSQLSDAAKAEACLTHRHPLAGDAAAAAVVLCRALIRGVLWEEALHRAAAGRVAEIRRALEERRGEDLSREGFSPNVLRAAVFFVGASSSFSGALARAVEFAGPSNYSPVLVGSLGGARWGRVAIHPRDLAHPPDVLARVRAVAADLAATWRESAPGGA